MDLILTLLIIIAFFLLYSFFGGDMGWELLYIIPIVFFLYSLFEGEGDKGKELLVYIILIALFCWLIIKLYDWGVLAPG